MDTTIDISKRKKQLVFAYSCCGRNISNSSRQTQVSGKLQMLTDKKARALKLCNTKTYVKSYHHWPEMCLPAHLLMGN